MIKKARLADQLLPSNDLHISDLGPNQARRQKKSITETLLVNSSNGQTQDLAIFLNILSVSYRESDKKGRKYWRCEKLSPISLSVGNDL